MKADTRTRSICFVAGCSGGHILPCLTLAQKKRAENPAIPVLFFTTNRSLDAKIIASAGDIVTEHIALPLTGLSGNKIYKLPLILWHLVYSFFVSIHHLRRWRPSSVLTTGSHIAIPVCLAAWILRIPVTLFEVNVQPGKTIRLLARFAQKIYVCYAQTTQHLPTPKCIRAPYPIKFNEADALRTQEQALAEINTHSPIPMPGIGTQQFSADKKTILILGGSQGSLFLNQLVKKILESSPSTIPHTHPTLEHLMRDHVQIIHQTGDLDQTDWKRFYSQRGIPALVFSYRDHMAPYYTAADVIICRAGAGTLAELIFFHKKSIVIPLETHATAHQLDNARAAAQEHPGLITVLRQQELVTDIQIITDTLTHILTH